MYWPPLFTPVTVYVAEGVIVVGVPLISPVVVSRVSPFGKDGETEKETTAPPLDKTVGEYDCETPFVIST